MIVISRAVAQRFRAVARRCAPNGRPRGPSPPVRVTAAEGTVTLTAHLGEVVLALTVPTPEAIPASLTLPLSVFESCEGNGTDTVALQAVKKTTGTARWQDRGLPRSLEFARVEGEIAWPAEPRKMVPVPAEFLSALHEAGRTADREASGRYALHRIQVRGKPGQVIGTDARHCLIQGGFEFPFTEDVNLPAVPVFGSKELVGEPTVGLADDWLCVSVGPWTIWLRHDAEVRFPDVEGAIPRATGTRVLFSDRDAELLIGDLQSWPKDFDGTGLVTLDLTAPVRVRAQIGQAGEVLERTLSDSTTTGPDAQVVLNRAHLARALALGFRQFASASPERPIVARDRHRVFLTATLDPKSAVPRGRPTENSTLERSTVTVPVGPGGPVSNNSPSYRRTTMPARESTPASERNGHAEPPAADSLDLLVEAEALRTLLTEAAGRIIRLVGSLKQYKRERRSLQAAWSSLRQLNLG